MQVSNCDRNSSRCSANVAPPPLTQVLDAHCGFLSNFEVLQLLREDVAEQDVHVKALKESFNQMKKKRFNQAPGKPEPPYIDYQDQLSKIVPHNVRTLQVEVRLSARQSLADYDPALS